MKSVFLSVWAVGGIIAAAVDPVGTTDEAVAWMIRGIITLGLASVAYLVRDSFKMLKETKKEVTDARREFASVMATVAAHQIMFEHWLDDLSKGDLDNPGRRKSDEILRKILELSQKK